ncbi:MAG TPA: hypothetical protein VGB56_13035 [Flavisolibacter sp.]|jgi:hypothetical protein
MKDEQDYIQDITEMRSMMERSSKFLSLSGLSAIILGIYALAGAFIAYKFFSFNPDQVVYGNTASGSVPADFLQVIFLAMAILVLAVATVVFFSSKKARKRGEKAWNPTARRLIINMAVPLIAGGVLILILIAKGLFGLMAPCSLIFYGLAMYNSGKFTYEEVRSLGLIEIGLGLAGCYFVEYGLLLWAIGFGVMNIAYGIYLHYKYER